MSLQGISPELVLLVSHSDHFAGGYSLNITNAEVLHVGQNLINISVSMGDTLDTSPFIASNSIRVMWLITIMIVMVCDFPLFVCIGTFY